jgi:putative aminopeptidase FrvX
MDTVSLLRTLTDAFGVAGFEDEVREAVRRLVEPFADEVRTDVLGNLLVTRRGRSDVTIMLDAHMDEIGLLVSHMDEKGFLRFAPLGGWDTRILPAQTVTIRTRDGRKVRGVIGSLPPHVLKPEERDKPIPPDSLVIDVGAASAAQARALGLQVGDPAVLGHPLEVLREGWVVGRSFDDRAGCAVLVKVLEALAERTPDATVVCAFAVSEETGLRGARTAAYQVNPQVALAVEATAAADLPGVAPQRQPTAVGAGAAITVADQSIVVSQRMVQALEDLARRHEVRYQIKLPLFGGTDAGAIHTTRAGVLAGVVSVPVRYIHSPVGLMALEDFEQVVRLVTAFAREARSLFGL